MTLIFVDSPIISQGAPRQRGLEDRSNTLALLKNHNSQGAFETNHVFMNIKAVELEAGNGRGRELNPAVIHLCDAEAHGRVLYSVESIFPEGLDCVVDGEFARSHQLRSRQVGKMSQLLGARKHGLVDFLSEPSGGGIIRRSRMSHGWVSTRPSNHGRVLWHPKPLSPIPDLFNNAADLLDRCNQRPLRVSSTTSLFLAWAKTTEETVHRCCKRHSAKRKTGHLAMPLFLHQTSSSSPTSQEQVQN